jgi:hypothetical protein
MVRQTPEEVAIWICNNVPAMRPQYGPEDEAVIAKAIQDLINVNSVKALMWELHTRYLAGPIDLRFLRGRWCVLLPVGNQMCVADASFADTPEQALRNTIAAWDARSPDKPFGWTV